MLPVGRSYLVPDFSLSRLFPNGELDDSATAILFSQISPQWRSPSATNRLLALYLLRSQLQDSGQQQWWRQINPLLMSSPLATMTTKAR